jgi:hypothetical protein
MRHINEYEEYAMGKMTQQELDDEFIGAIFETADVERARRLLKLGANVDARNQGETGLHYAAEFSPNMVELLCDHGADLEALDPQGRTPLVHARMWPPCARILLERGARAESAFSGFDDLRDFFEGDIDWVPDSAMQGLRRMKKTRRLFGM